MGCLLLFTGVVVVCVFRVSRFCFAGCARWVKTVMFASARVVRLIEVSWFVGCYTRLLKRGACSLS